ncbi:Appr-1'-p processing enzyme [Mactra antiquata]
MATPAENSTSTYLDLKSLKDGYLLEEFEFNQYMKQKYPDFDVEVYFIDDVCQLKVSGESGSLNIVNWLQHAAWFICDLHSRTIDTSNNIDKLLLDDANNSVDIVDRFIKAKVEEIYGKYRFLLLREGSSINMYCKNKNIAHDVTRVIENCFTSLVGVDICTDNGQKLVDDGKKTGQIYIEKRGDHMYNITGTIDVMKELKYPHVKYIMVQYLPRLILNYLGKYGEGILNSIYKDSFIDYILSESSIMLYANGPEQLKSAFKDLRSAIKKLRKSIKLPSDALTDTQRADIDGHMNYLQCCWTIQPINRPEHMLENCKYVTYWYDAIDELRISVVKGNPWDINFDLQIVFTTNNLFPYMETEDSKDKEAVSRFLEHGKGVMVKKLSPFSLGDTSSLLDDVKLDLSKKTSYVVGIVVTSDHGNHRQNISSSLLKRAYGNLLIESISKNIKTVGILADVKEQASSDPCYYKDFVEFILRRNSNGTNHLSHITDCVLCSIENPIHVVDELNTIFKNKHGYCQKNCSADTQMSADDVCRTVTELTVRSSPLQDEIADALVNTTNKELCLDKGKLSKNLLELAGPDLQKQCKKLYPGGLKPGQIAVTDSFDLSKKKNKCKRIYHVALPPYKYETFRKDIGMYVQKCLCQAERDGCEKIAFPAFGVGNLKYPRREVAEAMISAADEFCSEAINLNLRKIKFAVVKEDARTAEAFSDEDWRRSKKCAKLKLQKLNVQTEFSALNVPCDQRSIQITTTSYYNGLPSYAVCCHFDEFKTKGRYLKSASNDKYPTWNDCLYLGKIKDVKSTKKCLKGSHDEMKSERITLAVIYPSTELNQAEQVKKIVKYFKSVTGLPKLKTVIIIVTGEKELYDVGELLKLDVLSLSKPKESNFTIELIGKPDSLTKADDYIQKFIKPTFDKTDKRLNSSLLNKDKQDADSIEDDVCKFKCPDWGGDQVSSLSSECQFMPALYGSPVIVRMST